MWTRNLFLPISIEQAEFQLRPVLGAFAAGDTEAPDVFGLFSLLGHLTTVATSAP
jgi:hypothetical protein